MTKLRETQGSGKGGDFFIRQEGLRGQKPWARKKVLACIEPADTEELSGGEKRES